MGVLWPWPESQRDWFAARLRDRQQVPVALSRRFLRQLALGVLNPQPDCRVAVCRRGEPVVDLAAWAKMHRSDALAAHVWTADDRGYVAERVWARRLLGVALAAAGWWRFVQPPVVRQIRRRKPGGVWLGYRVK